MGSNPVGSIRFCSVAVIIIGSQPVEMGSTPIRSIGRIAKTVRQSAYNGSCRGAHPLTPISTRGTEVVRLSDKQDVAGSIPAGCMSDVSSRAE
jgi:hypothetical protein